MVFVVAPSCNLFLHFPESTYHAICVTERRTERKHQWFLWRGKTCRHGEEVLELFLTYRPPPLLPNAPIVRLSMKDENQQDRYSLLVERSICDLIVKDSSMGLQVGKCGVAAGYLPPSAARTLTPVKSPVCKKPRMHRGEESAAPRAKACLNFGNVKGDEHMADSLSGLALLATLAAKAPSTGAQEAVAVTAPNVLKIPTPEAKVIFNGPVDESFNTGDFVRFLETTAHTFEFTLADEVAVVRCGDVDLWTSECEVEFSNATIATRMCAIPDLSYGEVQVCFSQRMHVARKKPRETRATKYVKVSNLPSFFVEGHFRHHLDEAVGEAQGMAEVCKQQHAVKAITSYNKHTNSCIVEFVHKACALKVAGLSNFMYDRKVLAFEIVEDQISVKPSCSVQFSNLPRAFFPDHFTYHLKSHAVEAGIATDMENVVRSTSHDHATQSCIIEFISQKCAMEIAALNSYSYDRKTLQLCLLEEELVVRPSSLVKVLNLPNFFHKLHFKAHLDDMAVIYDIVPDDGHAVRDISCYREDEKTCLVQFISNDVAERMLEIGSHVYGKVKIQMEAVEEDAGMKCSAQNEAVEDHAAMKHGASQHAVSLQSDPSAPIPDIIAKAGLKPGQTASGKTGADWSTQKTAIFLKVHSVYVKGHVQSCSDVTWAQIRAHLWFVHTLDYSIPQLKEKMRGMKTYFISTVMHSDGGKDGTSNYPFYEAMLELFPDIKAQVMSRLQQVSAAPGTSSEGIQGNFKPIQAANDVWDKSAILLLISQCTDKQSLLNSVAGTDKARDVYKLVCSAMNEVAKRSFTWEECKKRMGALTAEYLLNVDVEAGQTGAGSAGWVRNDIDIHKAMQNFHAGSASVEAPVAFSFGAVNCRKQGAVAAVKVVGTGKKPKKVWDWKDAALTPRQRQLQLDASKVELQKETLELLKAIKQSRELKSGK